MRQRAVIAIALALNPELIIMDEPTTALDVVMQKQIIEEIQRLKDIFGRSEEHTSELQSLMRISYAVFCLKKKIILNESTHKSIKRYTCTSALIDTYTYI